MLDGLVGRHLKWMVVLKPGQDPRVMAKIVSYPILLTPPRAVLIASGYLSCILYEPKESTA